MSIIQSTGGSLLTGGVVMPNDDGATVMPGTGGTVISGGKLIEGGVARRTRHALYKLTLTAGVGGSTALSPIGPRYGVGTVVTATATPSDGYAFDAWDVDGDPETENPLTVTMDAAHTVAAAFIARYTLTLTAGANGDAVADPVGPVYDDGTEVALTATADEGYAFDAWDVDGDGETDNPLTLTMDADHTVAAAFAVAGPDYLVFDSFPIDGPLTTAETGQAWTQTDDFVAFPQSDSGVHGGKLITKGWASWIDAGTRDIDLTLVRGACPDTFFLTFRSAGVGSFPCLTIAAENPNAAYAFWTIYGPGREITTEIVQQPGDVIHVVAVGASVTWYINDVLAGTFDDSTRGAGAEGGTVDDNVEHLGTIIGLGDYDNAVANEVVSIAVTAPV